MDRFSNILALVFLLLIPFLARTAASAEPSAQRILELADEVRNPQSAYQVDVTVTSVKPGKEPKTAKYEVFIKGRDKTVIKTLYPPVDRGTSMLMLDYDFWVFLPTITKPLRISLQQRLLGEVANGDIARANFSGDYSPAFLRIDSIGGTEYYVLELNARDERVTYNRIVLWVQKDNYHPLKAEFYAVSGRLLKTASYEGYRTLAGEVRPSRLVLDDPLVRGQHSVIEYTDMIPKQLPDKYFAKDYLRKLKY